MEEESTRYTLKGDNPTYYRYDHSGKRTRNVTVKPGGIIEERLYFDGYEVFRKYTSFLVNFERQTLHLNDDNKRIALVETKTIENESGIEHPVSSIRYQYDNHLGSACLELDASADIISYEEYHPFGTTSYRSGRTETEVSLKRYKYVGKERDEESGLYYYGARYYAAWIARFVSVDPLQHKYPHYTPYQYAGNKPVSYVDLDGEEEKYVYPNSENKENSTDQSNQVKTPEKLNLQKKDLSVNDVVTKLIEISNYLSVTTQQVAFKASEYFTGFQENNLALDGPIQGTGLSNIHIDIKLKANDLIRVFQPNISDPNVWSGTLKQFEVVGKLKDSTKGKPNNPTKSENMNPIFSAIDFTGTAGGHINITGMDQVKSNQNEFNHTSFEGTRLVQYIASKLNESLYSRDFNLRLKSVNGTNVNTSLPYGYRLPLGHQHKYPLDQD